MGLGRILSTTLGLTLAASHAVPGQSAGQTITFQVDAINQISLSGSPSFVINTATPGSNPTAVIAPATWAVTTNQTGAKITASIGTAMPAGLTLSVTLQAPTGATSAGPSAISTTAVDLVTGITKLAQSALAVTYALSATPTAGVVGSQSRTVIYTITGGT